MTTKPTNKLFSAVAGAGLAFTGALGMSNSSLADDAQDALGRPATSASQDFALLDRGGAQQDDMLEVIKSLYPAEQRDGYTYIRMDHLPDHPYASTLNVTELETIYSLDGNPIIITNYSAEGYRYSAHQADFHEKVLPLIASRSERDIVFIDVTALRENANGLPENVFMESLLSNQEENRLGDNGTSLPFKGLDYLLPYGAVYLNGKKVFDYSLAQYEPLTAQIKNDLAKDLLIITQRANEQILSANHSGEQPIMAAD